MVWKNGILGKVAEKGLNRVEFALLMEWSAPTLRNKLNSKTDLTLKEIEKMCSILDIKDKDKYFFCPQYSKME